MRITRTEYLNKLIAFKDKQLIKVVTGIRRCGKSVLMEMYQDWLLQNGVEPDQIIAINFEDMDFEELTDYRKLYAYLKNRLVPEKMTYIFLDEIQHVTDFPKVIDSLYIKKNVDIYVTGSNAYMLSSEIATLISGRYVQIEMLPLSFKEYMQSTGSMEDRGIKYTEYLENSSSPELIREREPVLTREDEMAEFMFLGLRMTKGIAKTDFRQKFGCAIETVYGDVLKKYEAMGLLLEKDGRIFLSREGIHVSNSVMADFLP